MPIQSDLQGKIAFITGGSSGIGAATARLFAGLGARVALGYHANQNGALEIVEWIAGSGGTAIAVPADFRNMQEIRAAVDQVVKELGPIDILVNNAGALVRRAAIRDVTEDLWDEVMALNFKSAVFASQAVVQSMIDRHSGVIINVASIAAQTGGREGAGTYASAKAGLISFTKNLAREMAPLGIRVNAISPGIIDTGFHTDREMFADFVKTIPLGRAGTSEECASVIAFLASSAAAFLVGETIEINGGQLMR